LSQPLNDSTVLADTLTKGSANNTDNLHGEGGLDWFWADPMVIQQTLLGIRIIRGDNILDLETVN
jgi:hypothetical protein